MSNPEQWKVVERFPEYEVSDRGRIRRTKSKRVLKTWSTNHKPTTWYPMIKIHQKNQYVHRLVAETFLPNPDGLPQVNHINGDKSDNRVDNLEWTNASHNQIHAIKTELHRTIDGCCHGRRPIVAYCKPTNEVEHYDSVQEAARATDVDPRKIVYNARGKRRSPHPDYEYWYVDDQIDDLDE